MDQNNTESEPIQSRGHSGPQKPKEGLNHLYHPSRQRPNHSYHGQNTRHTKIQRITGRQINLYPSKHQLDTGTGQSDQEIP